MPTVTVTGVELARLGTWAASTGMVTLTPPDFADMVAASQDPEVDHAAMKIGHVDTRFADGEPALGWLANLRTVGDRLVADLTDVPAGLAPRLADAFRRRSVEIAWGVTTPGGRRYRAVITGLAALGVTPPAVKGLADVAALYDAPAQRTAASTTVATSSSSLTMGAADAELDVARTALAALASAAGAPPQAGAALLEALEGLAGAAVAGIPHQSAAGGEHGANDATPGGPQVNEARIRELLGLEADADVEAAVAAIKAKADAAPAAPAAPAAGAPLAPVAGAQVADPPAAPAAAAPATPAAPAATPAAPAAPAAPELVGAGALAASQPAPPATVTLSAAQWAEVQATLGNVVEARRTGAVDNAIREGRIHPSERDAYLAQMTRDEAGTTTLLSTLAPKFPTTELGTAEPAAALAAPADEAAWADFGASIGVPGLGAPAASSK